MANIIYDRTDDYSSIPGIPYEDRFKFVRVFMTDTVPSVQDLENILVHGNSETLVTPWSLDVVRGFRDYMPTTFNKVIESMPQELVEANFGLQKDWKPEQERILLQLQSELDAKSATIDAALIHNRKDYGGIINKVHLINRIYNIGKLHGHFADRSAEYPFLFGGEFHDPATWDSTLISVKKMFIDFILEVPLGKRWYGMKVRTCEASSYDLKERFVYVDWLKEKLGDDLVGVLLYGSAARTDDPKGYSDFDNWVRVKDVAKAQRILSGTCPAVFEGKVISLSNGEHPEGAKHLGIHLFPDSDDYMLRFVRFLHDSREFLKHTQVLYGEMPFIKVKQDEVIERGVSQAYIKLKTIAGALNWAYTIPDKMMGKQALFEFVVKNVRFFLQHALNAVEGPQLRTKAELNERLAERGLHIPEYRCDPVHIKHSILYAMHSVLRLQSEFLHSSRKANFLFLNEKKDYSWDDPTIDSFVGMRDLP